MAARAAPEPVLMLSRAGIVAAIAASLLLGACSQFVGDVSPAALVTGSKPAPAADADAQRPPQTELEKATDYWAKEYAKDPRNLDNVLSYAKNLKAMGQKSQALAILQNASLYHANDKRLASEYGRVALDLDQVSLAKQLLAVADDPVAPDWRVILARGTVLAKEGRYKEAVEFYERARALAPDHPSVLNNLALAYTMSGEPARAEGLLRTAAAAEGANAKVRQNLALVLGLQGKYDEATKVASTDLAQESARANADLLRKIVKAEPKAMPAETVETSPTEVVEAPAGEPAIKPALAETEHAGPDEVTIEPVASAEPPAEAAPPAFLKPSTN
jgi:Flp pilus assembly protein TadD